MDAVANTQHLIQRNGRWYYHRRVPKEQRARFGSVIKEALGTADRKQAIKLREIRDVEWSARFHSADHEHADGDAPPEIKVESPQLTEPLALRLVREYVERTDRRYRQQWAKGSPRSREARLEAIENAELDLAVASNRARQYDHIGFVTEKMHAIASEAGVGIEGDNFTSEEFYGIVKRALIELARRELSRAQDDHAKPSFDHLFGPSVTKPVTVEELAVQFLAYETEEALAHRLSAKHIIKVKASVALIEDLLGRQTLVQSIDFDRCRELCSWLAQLPPNRTKAYGKLPIAQVLERARAEGLPVLSFISQQQHLGMLKQLLDLAVSKGLLRTNPATTLRPLAIDELAAGDKRVPFDAGQLQAFFNCEFYNRCAASASSPYRAADRDWRFWLPLVCLFMGMRPREVCQLHISDLCRTEAGTWYLRIEATQGEAGPAGKTTKTKTSRRSLPLHIQLERLGFVDFVREQTAASDDPRLFRTITRDRYGDPARYPLRRFNETYLPEAISLRPKQSFYSFRHTWRDAVRLVNPPDDFLQAVGGWNKGKVTSDNYGSLDHPDRYAAYMNEVSFAGLDLSHLYVGG